MLARAVGEIGRSAGLAVARRAGDGPQAVQRLGLAHVTGSAPVEGLGPQGLFGRVGQHIEPSQAGLPAAASHVPGAASDALRSEEHTSELQSLMRISYAVFCLKKKQKAIQT